MLRVCHYFGLKNNVRGLRISLVVLNSYAEIVFVSSMTETSGGQFTR